MGTAARRGAGARQCREAACRELDGRRTGRRFRHHGGARRAGACGYGVRRPGAGLRANPARLRSPLHVLRHPVRTRTKPQRAGRCGDRAGARAGRFRVSGTGADRRGHRELRGRSARHAPRPTGAAAAGAGRCAPLAAVVARSRRDRRRSLAADRRGAPADAAPSLVAASRKRPDPQAHAAPPPHRRCAPGDRARARAATRHRHRRRFDRGLSDRDRAAV